MFMDLERRLKVIEEKLLSERIDIPYKESNKEMHKNEIFITGITAFITDNPIHISSMIFKAIGISYSNNSIYRLEKQR